MDLPKSIVKEFAKQAVEKKPTVDKPTQLVGTVHVEDGQTFVYLDGSNGSKTPVSETVAYQSGDRVLVSIQNRKATIIGNYTGPSINQALDNVIVEYALSSNSVSFIAWPGEKGEWNTIAPEKEDGSYMWQRTTKISTNPLVNPEISLTCIQGSDGENGYTPYIGSNGNWWINGVDTGYSAEGDDGHSPYVDTTTNTWWEWDANIGNYHDTGIVPQGPGVFKSIVFKRFSSQPSAPTGGSYLSPVPSGWSDGIPSGTEQIWISTRVFTSDGESPQTSEWTTPQMASDTPDIDFEYSWIVTNPGNPTDNPDNWSNAATENSIWMAVRKKSIGTWSSWEINKIKGEDGKTYYTWIKYADSPTSGMSDNPSGKAYIGIAHNKTSATESTTYSDYTWSLIKGETGADGNGITTIKQYYARTTTFSKPSAESITSTTMPELDNTYRYLWMKEVIAFTKSENQTVITLIAARGDNGEMSPEQVAQLNKASQDASAAVNKVDNLEIGGRNLLLYSSFTNVNKWFLNGTDFTSDVRLTHSADGGKIEIINTATGSMVNAYKFVNYNNTYEFLSTEFKKHIQGGVWLTLSCDIKINFDTDGLDCLAFDFRTMDSHSQVRRLDNFFPNNMAKNTWVRVKTSAYIKEITDKTIGRNLFSIVIRSDAGRTAGSTVEYRNVKLEIGNKATDWTPAPEDVDEGIKNAAKTATNYIHSDSTNGLVVNNNQTVGVGYDVQLKANGSDTGMNIRQDGNILASFLQNSVSLGKNSINSKVAMCGDKGGVSASFGYYIDSVSSNNAEMGSTLSFDFNETTFKNKVGQKTGFYDFSYTSADGWTLFDYVNDTSYPVTLSQYGITLRTPTSSLNDHAQIVINYVLDGSVKFYNADISNPVRKLELEMAENPSSSESDYANITIERQSGTYANGDGKEHSIITMMTLHEFANVATLQLFDDSISLDATHVHLTSTGGEGSIQLNGDTNIDGNTKIWGQFQVVNLAGEIKMWAGDAIPYGWLLCDGSEVRKTDYPELYGAIGDLWGVPSSSSNFKLPNLTGRVPVGYNSADTDTTETFGKVGATGGARGAWYHTHTIGSSGAHNHASVGRVEGSASGANIFESFNGASKTRAVNVPRSGNNGAHTHSPGASGSSGNKLAADKANMPPYAVIKYIICAI